ncbi:MAG: radical SAM protein [Deltaproteobacteria bacterium]|nr:radical SAM protein [Deltaproteobacteria bacterium]
MLPDVVGISIRNIHIYDKVLNELIFPLKYLVDTIKIIKKTKWNIPIIAGGAGFSMYPRQFMTEAPEIKYGIFLEGEEFFPQLLDNLDSPYNVKGIFIRDKNEIVFTGDRSFVNFENSIIPDRTFIPFDNCKKGNYSLGVQSKRGCSLQCFYCSYPYLNGSKLKLRDPKDIVAEIEELCYIHGVTEFAFADNVFNIPASHAEKICKEIIKRGINVNWIAWFNEQFMDERFVDLCLEAGCRLFEFSPDGFSNKSLRWLRKNIQTCHIQNTYNIARKKNMEVSYNFIIGIPGQGPISLIRQTIFILKAKIFLGKKLKRIQFSKLGIEPSTALAKLAIEEKK